MKDIYSICIVCALLLFSMKATGQNPEVRAELCSDTVMVGHQFTLTYIVSGGQINKLEDAPNIESFNLLSGPNTSSSMSIVNGQMSSSSSVNYVLQALQPGDYTIDPIMLLIEEKEYTVEPLKIVIVENPDGTTMEDLLPAAPSKIQPKKKRKTFKL